MDYKMNGLTDKELLKMMVKEPREGVFEEVFERFNMPDLILNVSYEELITIDGIGDITAKKLVSLKEVFKRLSDSQYHTRKVKIKSPEDVYTLMKPIIGWLHVEEFYILLLNTKNEVDERIMISRGSLNASIVHPREVFRQAISKSAASIILVHNHPSAHTAPSKEDIKITKRLCEAGDIIGIKVLDHIIVGNGYYSFKEDRII